MFCVDLEILAVRKEGRYCGILVVLVFGEVLVACVREEYCLHAYGKKSGCLSGDAAGFQLLERILVSMIGKLVTL